MGKVNLAGLVAIAALCGTAGLHAQDAGKTPALKPLTPEILKHVAESVRLAGGYTNPLYGLYSPARQFHLVLPSELALLPHNIAGGGGGNAEGEGGIRGTVQPPTKLFDQLYYFGSSFVGSVVLVTSGGIIQWDAMDNDNEAKNLVEADYEKVGLDPKNIKYIIITHGHGDHFGGVSYFQAKYPGIHVLESEADWQLIASTKPKPGMPLPRKDMVVKDGEKLTLGDTTVSLYVTPGHTPGSVSSIIKVTDHGTPHVLAMFGGMTIPPQLAPVARNAGLDEFARQWKRFGAAAKAAGADGVISTHPWADGMVANIKTLEARKAGDPNPFIRGKNGYDNYLESGEEVIAAVRGMIQLNGGG